jgi:hypothetical protein
MNQVGQMRTIDDLYEQILIESKYADGGRDVITGIFLIGIAIVLLLLSVVFFYGFGGTFYFWILFIPSLIFGFFGLLSYLRGKDAMFDAVHSKELEQTQEEQQP